MRALFASLLARQDLLGVGEEKESVQRGRKEAGIMSKKKPPLFIEGTCLIFRFQRVDFSFQHDDLIYSCI